MMRSTARKTAAAAAGIALAAGTVLTTAEVASAAPAAPAATCTTSALHASLVDKGSQVGMSHIGKVLVLKNTSGRTCALRGYPGLRLENGRHQPQTTHTHWGGTYFVPDPGTKTIALRPGQSAEADLAWADADAPRMVHAGYLELTPPGSRTHLTIPFKNVVTNGDLSVTAFARSVKVS
ncbi:DUF4232 domain-containing protein [Streptantibioticus ferralitis]|uniref:DUF4232 domain-containing protein n=1 Tax=Streptantibioticus ferralitis TaxID=236510 RepID=A0ABT5YU48_9ACTN|nr:DUF4232 domain-containing protein [Streptantibioticus ferralitis]MDF2255013.1 DUF4232 domain-containing protein [Streptantibioticus ferralitis]